VAAAQVAERLTLGDAVRRALQVHPQIRAARARSAAAEAAGDEVAARRLPQLALSGVATRFEEPMIVAPLHGFDIRNPPVFDRTLIQGSVNLSYTLFDGGARRGRVGAARAEAERAAREEEAAEQGLIAEVARRYLEVLTASGIWDARREGVAALEAESLRVEYALGEGRAARVQLLQVSAALAQARAEEVAASGRLEVARNELARALGWESWTEELGSLGELKMREAALPEVEELRRRARQSNPELLAAARRVDAARGSRAAALAQWLPQLELAGGYLGFGSGQGGFVAEWQFGARLSYPLFAGGARAAGVRRAGYEVAAAEAMLGEVERDLMGVLDRTLAAYREAQARVAAGATAVAHYEELVRIERLRLETGAGTEADFLKAEADLRRAQAAALEARHGLLLSRIQLARITGELNLRWLEENFEEVR
jgi:outer membrane protein TolC